MPRFYFHIVDGVASPDEDGTELKDVYEAQNQAVKLCGSLLKDLGAKFWNHGMLQVNAQDEAGVDLFSLTVTSVEITSHVK